MCNMVIWRRTDTPKMLVSHPTHEHGWLTDGDSNMMPLWFDGGCLPKVLMTMMTCPIQRSLKMIMKRTLRLMQNNHCSF